MGTFCASTFFLNHSYSVATPGIRSEWYDWRHCGRISKANPSLFLTIIHTATSKNAANSTSYRMTKASDSVVQPDLHHPVWSCPSNQRSPSGSYSSALHPFQMNDETLQPSPVEDITQPLGLGITYMQSRESNSLSRPSRHNYVTFFDTAISVLVLDVPKATILRLPSM